MVASICGWSSLVLWVVCTYPQPVFNCKRSSTRGLSADFVAFNVLAHFNYLLFSATTYIEETDGEGTVGLNDVLFSLHSLVMGLVIWIQMWCYRHPQGVSRPCKALFAAEVLGIAVSAAFVASGELPLVDTHGGFAAVQLAGYAKVVCVFLKYSRQAQENCARGSTDGLSFVFVTLDLAGAVLNLTQNLVNAAVFNDFDYIVGNIPKLGLCLAAITLDSTYWVQNCIFTEREKRTLRNSPFSSSKTTFLSEPSAEERADVIRLGCHKGISFWCFCCSQLSCLPSCWVIPALTLTIALKRVKVKR